MVRMNLQSVLDAVLPFVTTYGLRVVGAVIILIVGGIASRVTERILRRLMERARVDTTVGVFVGNLARYAVLTFAVIAALAQFGVQTTSFIAVLGAAGLAVGLALQGSLSNFAAGVLILLFRPFSLEDFITAAGSSGTVKHIGIFTTTLFSPDNKKIILPNAAVTGGTIVNVNANPTRRVDLTASIAYGDDIGRARAVLEKILADHPKVLADPAPAVRLMELGESSVNFVVRPWVNTPDYWDVYFELTRTIKEGLEAGGLTIPFPQRDVHLHQATG